MRATKSAPASSWSRPLLQVGPLELFVVVVGGGGGRVGLGRGLEGWVREPASFIFPVDPGQPGPKLTPPSPHFTGQSMVWLSPICDSRSSNLRLRPSGAIYTTVICMRHSNAPGIHLFRAHFPLGGEQGLSVEPQSPALDSVPNVGITGEAPDRSVGECAKATDAGGSTIAGENCVRLPSSGCAGKEQQRRRDECELQVWSLLSFSRVTDHMGCRSIGLDVVLHAAALWTRCLLAVPVHSLCLETSQKGMMGCAFQSDSCRFALPYIAKDAGGTKAITLRFLLHPPPPSPGSPVCCFIRGNNTFTGPSPHASAHPPPTPFQCSAVWGSVVCTASLRVTGSLAHTNVLQCGLRGKGARRRAAQVGVSW